MTLSLAVACSHIPEVENREPDEGEGKIWRFNFAHDWTFQEMFFIHSVIVSLDQALIRNRVGELIHFDITYRSENSYFRMARAKKTLLDRLKNGKTKLLR